jgi:hypothetical protein
MSDVINLIKLKRNTERTTLTELEVQAKERFESMSLLVNCDWEDLQWSYLKQSQLIKFQLLGGGELPSELLILSKIFIVDVLWNQRLRAEPFSHSYITNIVIPFKIWAEMDIGLLADINQDAYDATINYLKTRYAEPQSVGVSLNKAVNYLNDNHLLMAHIDTTNIRKALGNTDEHGNVLAKKAKMPLPELVKAVIHLKWAVDDNFDGSLKAVNDKLCILTQIFQYGLGLRLGEVLRLPKEPLIEVEGEMFCLVWTEKGATPISRYVPLIWRKPLVDAVEEIHKLTKPYRDIAIQIEQKGALGFFDERFKLFNQEKEAQLAIKIDELNELLQARKITATKLWKLRQPVEALNRYELQELSRILPVASSASDSHSLYKYYKKMGLEIISETSGKRRNKYYVTGKAITKVLDGLILQRATHITLRELLTIINPNRSNTTIATKDKLIKGYTEKLTGRPTYLSFADESYSKDGSAIAVVTRDNALKILKSYVLGGYKHREYIPLKNLETLLPELFNQKSASKAYIKELCGNTTHTFYVKHSGDREYTKTEGYLVNVRKLKNYFVSEFERLNLAIEKELIDESIDEYKSDGVEISSKSFSIKQQPSEHLFIRAGMRGGVYYEHLPQILGYYAGTYFFGGNERQKDAFKRYGVSIESHIAESWQSHKGRHWQTTSLFRAGMAELLVNKWMGRTTGQGENYDHNTGRERAKIVGEAMLKNTERFLGDVPEKVMEWKQQEVSASSMSDHLTNTLQSIQYSPLGYCTRALYLKPCEFNLKCLTGNDGKGCKHYIYDLHDPSHREKITAERDRSSIELSRLFEVYERGIEAAKMHIEHHMIILRNTTSILDNAEIILDDDQLEDLQDYRPFKREGSYSDDCPFQCGGDE